MISLLTDPDLDEFCAHLERGMAQSGREGLPVFHPLPAAAIAGRYTAEKKAQMLGRWCKSLDEVGWGRAWGLREGGRVLGHVNLRGGEPETRAHRAELGLGVERAYIGHGHGQRLMETAIDWARAQGLAWIDLGVFAENAPARALYAKLGFVETGRREDLFRVDGRSIDDIEMSLRLNP
jgi:RimJ/RimL family protein N-acetyltransferase